MRRLNSQETRTQFDVPAKPPPSRVRVLLFNILLPITVLACVVCGTLTYAIWSKGEIFKDWYEELASADLTLFTWVTAGVCILGGVFVLATYAFSLDYRRPRRPWKRLYLLWMATGILVAGVLLGYFEVEADNIAVILAAAAAVFVFPIPLLLLERVVGGTFIRSAEGLLKTGASGTAGASARMGLRFASSDPRGEAALGLALARAGKSTDCLPYLINDNVELASCSLPVVEALADVYENCQLHERAAAALEILNQTVPSPAVFERMIHQWIALNRRKDVFQALQALPATERADWRTLLQELTFEFGSVGDKVAFSREVESTDSSPFQKATECYQQVLQQHPGNLEATKALIGLAKKRNEPDRAAQLMEKLVDLDADNSDQVRRELVNHYWLKGQRDKVLGHLNRLLLAGRATTEEKLRILDEHFSQGDYARVEELVCGDDALVVSPRALITLAYALYEGGRLPESLEAISTARKEQPDFQTATDLDHLETKIRTQIRGRQQDELKDRLSQNPNDLAVRFEYYQLILPGGSDRIVRELDEILEKQPEHKNEIEREIRQLLAKHGKIPRLLDYLGDLYLRDKDYDQAFELYEMRSAGELDAGSLLHDGTSRILDQMPKHLPSLMSEIKYHNSAGRAKEALQYLDRYRDAGGPANAGLNELELEASLAAGDLDRAERVGTSLLADSPGNAQLLAGMAEVALNRQQFRLSVERYNAAAAADPSNHHYRLKAKKADEARRRARIADLHSLVAADPANSAAQEELADLHHDFGELNEAISHYQKASLANPASPWRIPRTKLAYVLARKRLFQETEDTLSEIDLPPTLPSEEMLSLKSLLYNTALLLEEEGEPNRAFQIYRRIFRVDAGFKDVVERVEMLQKTDKKAR